MTWTRAFGNGSGWLLQKIVNGLALSRISPNTLTFIGLIINVVAAFFFGYARADNYVRMFLYAGLVIIGARGNRFFYVFLVAFVMTASLMVSYTRARAEALIGSCKVGFMERPERVVLIILGALFERWDAMAPALWILAIMTTITVIHRIRYTYLETERRKLKLSPK
jgi:CDP-diacylglycerol--glycerol-3-phosphate 3-phosphatidyltransferase